jgi:hypothetical protein
VRALRKTLKLAKGSLGGRQRHPKQRAATTKTDERGCRVAGPQRSQYQFGRDRGLVKWLGLKAGKEWFDSCFACFEEGGKEQAGG